MHKRYVSIHNSVPFVFIFLNLLPNENRSSLFSISAIVVGL